MPSTADLLTRDEPLSNNFKSQLKHISIDVDCPELPYFDKLAISYGEGTASANEEIEYKRLVFENKKDETSARIYKNCFLKPDLSVVYDDKKSLRKHTLLPFVIKITAAAACLTLFAFSVLYKMQNNIIKTPASQTAYVSIFRINNQTTASDIISTSKPENQKTKKIIRNEIADANTQKIDSIKSVEKNLTSAIADAQTEETLIKNLPQELEINSVKSEIINIQPVNDKPKNEILAYAGNKFHSLISGFGFSKVKVSVNRDAEGNFKGLALSTPENEFIIEKI